ncbi:MAG TPA: hypothetical protein VN457_01965, partial [Chlamydiales bacterium]|nr:hypothetical protein [Chlamydiales bacterium]
LWVGTFILALIVLRAYFYRLNSYTQSAFVLKKAAKEVKKAILRGDEREAFLWIETIVEAASQAIQEGSLRNATLAFENMLQCVDSFVKGSSQSSALSDSSLTDRVQYFSVYLFRRLEWLFARSLSAHMEPVAEGILSTFGKICVSLAQFHPMLSHLPLLFIEKCCNEAIENDADELAARAQATLSELAKTFIRISREKGESKREIVLKALSHLETGVKNNFKKKKEMSVALLMQPFAEIGDLLAEPYYQSFPNREEYIAELRRILQEFSVLDVSIQAPSITAAGGTEDVIESSSR